MLQNLVSNIGGTSTSVSTDISSIKEDIEALQSGLSDLQNTVTSLSSVVSTEQVNADNVAVSNTLDASAVVSNTMVSCSANVNGNLTANSITSASAAIDTITNSRIDTDCVKGTRACFGCLRVSGCITPDSITASAGTFNTVTTGIMAASTGNITNATIGTVISDQAHFRIANLTNATVTNANIGTEFVTTSRVINETANNITVCDTLNAATANISDKLTATVAELEALKSGSIKATGSLNLDPELPTGTSFYSVFIPNFDNYYLTLTGTHQVGANTREVSVSVVGTKGTAIIQGHGDTYNEIKGIQFVKNSDDPNIDGTYIQLRADTALDYLLIYNDNTFTESDITATLNYEAPYTYEFTPEKTDFYLFRGYDDETSQFEYGGTVHFYRMTASGVRYDALETDDLTVVNSFTTSECWDSGGTSLAFTKGNDNDYLSTCHDPSISCAEKQDKVVWRTPVDTISGVLGDSTCLITERSVSKYNGTSVTESLSFDIPATISSIGSEATELPSDWLDNWKVYKDYIIADNDSADVNSAFTNVFAVSNIEKYKSGRYKSVTMGVARYDNAALDEYEFTTYSYTDDPADQPLTGYYYSWAGAGSVTFTVPSETQYNITNLGDNTCVHGKITADTAHITGDTVIDGDLHVSGTTFTDDVENVVSTADYEVLRANNGTGLASNSYSGIIVNNYNGTDEAAAVFDNTGTARVGTGTASSITCPVIYLSTNDNKYYDDEALTILSSVTGVLTSWGSVEKEADYRKYTNAIFSSLQLSCTQPILTRAEEADMEDGYVLRWNADDVCSQTCGTACTHDACVCGDLCVTGTADIDGITCVHNNAVIDCNLTVTGTSTLVGASCFCSTVDIDGVASVHNNAVIDCNLTVENNAEVCGSATVDTDLDVCGDTSVVKLISTGVNCLGYNDDCEQAGCPSDKPTIIYGDLTVCGAAQLQGVASDCVFTIEQACQQDYYPLFVQTNYDQGVQGANRVYTCGCFTYNPGTNTLNVNNGQLMTSPSCNCGTLVGSSATTAICQTTNTIKESAESSSNGFCINTSATSGIELNGTGCVSCITSKVCVNSDRVYSCVGKDNCYTDKVSCIGKDSTELQYQFSKYYSDCTVADNSNFYNKKCLYCSVGTLLNCTCCTPDVVCSKICANNVGQHVKTDCVGLSETVICDSTYCSSAALTPEYFCHSYCPRAFPDNNSTLGHYQTALSYAGNCGSDHAYINIIPESELAEITWRECADYCGTPYIRCCSEVRLENLNTHMANCYVCQTDSLTTEYCGGFHAECCNAYIDTLHCWDCICRNAYLDIDPDNGYCLDFVRVKEDDYTCSCIYSNPIGIYIRGCCSCCFCDSYANANIVPARGISLDYYSDAVSPYRCSTLSMADDNVSIIYCRIGSTSNCWISDQYGFYQCTCGGCGGTFMSRTCWLVLGNDNSMGGCFGYNIMCNSGKCANQVIIGNSNYMANMKNSITIGYCNVDCCNVHCNNIIIGSCISSCCSTSSGDITCGQILIGTSLYVPASNCAGNYRQVGIGFASCVQNSDAIAIGSCAKAIGGLGPIAVGYSACAAASHAIAIGDNPKATCSNAVAIGYCASASADNAFAVGNYASSTGVSSIAIGCCASSANSGIAIGITSKAVGDYSVVVGYNSCACGVAAKSFGNNNNSAGDYSLTVGKANIAYGSCAVVVGNDSVATGGNSAVIGVCSQASNYASFAAGYKTIAQGEHGIAIGYCACSCGCDSVAIGRNARTDTNSFGVAIGCGACAGCACGTWYVSKEIVSPFVREITLVDESNVFMTPVYSCCLYCWLIAKGFINNRTYPAVGGTYHCSGQTVVFQGIKLCSNNIFLQTDNGSYQNLAGNCYCHPYFTVWKNQCW